jgi:pilus assembly protein CpaC
MQSKSIILARPIALVIGAAMVLGSVADAAPRKGARANAARVKTVRATVPVRPPAGVQRPVGEVYLSAGRGQLITLPVPISDVFVSNDSVADVRVQSPTQIYLFGKSDGETSVYATARSGKVVYSTNVRVAQNYNSLDQMLKVALPDADVKVTLSGQIAVLTGTVASPADIANAESLTKAILNPGVNVTDPTAMLKVMVINRLKTATPMQVNLQVRIAEVSRSYVKEIGVNWTNRDQSNGGPVYGIFQGRSPGTISNGANGGTTFNFTPKGSTSTTLSIGARLLGMDIAGALDLGETEGFVTTLASPNLTALSGETANFLAGGEIPIPIAQSLGAVSVEFKPYGVNLAFTPTVMSDGRISLRVKPEVSDLDYQNAVTFQGTTVPGISTRRAETTIELGSGQSFVIGGLLKSSNANTMQKTPGAGDIPVLGALFRSNGFRRGETELMIVVTPYLVVPVPANEIILPTDGYKAPTDLGRIFGGQLYQGTTGEKRPQPTVSPSTTVVRPQISSGLTPEPMTPTPTARMGATPAPGFSK